MRKIIITYGLIAGAIIIGTMIIGLALDGNSEHLAGLEWLGYLVMILAFGMIFVGIKRYRDQQLGGVIRFGTAFALGIGITLVASAIYVVAWEMNLALTDHAFINDYTQSVLDTKAAAGASAEELAQAETEMAQLKQQYANPLYRLPITFLEIFPVGLLITLISAAVLRNAKVLPATA